MPMSSPREVRQRLRTTGAPRICRILLLVALGPGALAAHAADWPAGTWAPALALDVPIAHFSAQDANPVTILCRLANECGLVFGYADIIPGSAPPARVTFTLEGCTVRDVTTELSKTTPGFQWGTVDGVVTAIRLGDDGSRPAVLDANIAAFDAADLPLGDFKSRLFGALAELKAFPPLYSFGHEVYGARGIPRVTLHSANVSALQLLNRSAALLNQSWMLDLDTSRQRAVFQMGTSWGALPTGKVEVEVAPGAPKGTAPGQPPTREAVQEGVHAALLNARLRRVQGEEAADELASLIDDMWARQYAWMDVLEAVELLGNMRAETATDALVRNIDLGGAAVKTLREQLNAAKEGTGVYGNAPDTPPEARQAVAYQAWVRSFPAVEALLKIGLPAVPGILSALADIDSTTPPGPNEPTNAQTEREGKVILFCETLQRMLGRQAAADRLEQEAAAQQDAAAATRLRDAAKRITEGVMPSVPE